MRAMRPGKTKVCANRDCRCVFAPDRPMQRVCSPACGLALARLNREKADKAKRQLDRRQTRAAMERLKTPRDYMREAQTVINRYVRLRDADLGCISCNKPASWPGQWHASHFRSVGAAPQLRFNLWNIHKGCSVCNNHLSGNIMAYRPALVAKIGAERVDWLERQNGVARLTVDYLQRLKRVFARKCRLLEARRHGKAG